jgi:hypothetical protein
MLRCEITCRNSILGRGTGNKNLLGGPIRITRRSCHALDQEWITLNRSDRRRRLVCPAMVFVCASLALPLGDGLAAGMHSGLGKEPGSRLLVLCQAATAPPRGPDGVNAVSQADARACLAFIDGFAWGTRVGIVARVT